MGVNQEIKQAGLLNIAQYIVCPYTMSQLCAAHISLISYGNGNKLNKCKTLKRYSH